MCLDAKVPKNIDEDKTLLEFIERIVADLPDHLRMEALEKGFMVKTKEHKGELKFGVSVPGASSRLKGALERVFVQSKVHRK